MQAFGLSPYNFCVYWKVANIIRVNQVTRHPSSIGSDKPSKDPEIRQVRKLHSNAQKVEKKFKKKQKAKGTGQKPTLKLNLPYPETVCCLFEEANRKTIEKSDGI